MYASSNPSDPDICNLKSKLSLPKLIQVHLEILEAPVTIKAIIVATEALMMEKP